LPRFLSARSLIQERLFYCKLCCIIFSLGKFVSFYLFCKKKKLSNFSFNFLSCEKLISCSDLGDHGPNDGRWDNDSQDQVSGCRRLPSCLQVPYLTCTYRRYLLPHGTYYVEVPVPVYKNRCLFSGVKIQILSLDFIL
jgi:hypothetical protein